MPNNKTFVCNPLTSDHIAVNFHFQILNFSNYRYVFIEKNFVFIKKSVLMFRDNLFLSLKNHKQLKLKRGKNILLNYLK